MLKVVWLLKYYYKIDHIIRIELHATKCSINMLYNKNKGWSNKILYLVHGRNVYLQRKHNHNIFPDFPSKLTKCLFNN